MRKDFFQVIKITLVKRLKVKILARHQVGHNAQCSTIKMLMSTLTKSNEDYWVINTYLGL